MKQCKYCGECKPLSDYHKNKLSKDGHKAHCKECNKAYSLKWRADNLDHARAYDRERGSRRSADDTREYRQQNPIKYAAHILVNNKVRSGDILKANCCECCGENKKLHGHHDDYAKPLEVRWLCATCHGEWHQTHGEALNAH